MDLKKIGDVEFEAEKDESKGVFFYHSKLAAQIREVLSGKGTLPKKSRAMSLHFVAGMFDIRGRMANRVLYLNGLDRADTLLLELLGIHTHGSRITNPIEFISLMRGGSIMASAVRLPA